jgi:acyl carrier protein
MSQKIEEIIFSVIDEINTNLPPDKQLRKQKETILFGLGGGLDSLGLVHFIVEVEENISTAFSSSITLADAKAFSQKNSPFRTVESLTAYINSKLQEAQA